MNEDLIPHEIIETKIYVIRGKKVMLDRDLALLYEVETRALNQAVKRNIKRFPEEFMFQLSEEEMSDWKSQIVISNSIKMGLRKRPLAFTEHGVAMLSSVLKSERAIQVNIKIIKTFIKLREILLTHQELKQHIEKIEQRVDGHEQYFRIVFDALKQLMEPDNLPQKKIGFHIEKKDNTNEA